MTISYIILYIILQMPVWIPVVGYDITEIRYLGRLVSLLRKFLDMFRANVALAHPYHGKSCSKFAWIPHSGLAQGEIRVTMYLEIA